MNRKQVQANPKNYGKNLPTQSKDFLAALFNKGVALSLLIFLGITAHANPEPDTPYPKGKDSGSTASCIYALSATTKWVRSAGGTGQVELTTESSCSWTATASVPWIHITSGAGTRTGNGSVVYSYDANTTDYDRTGIITIGGQYHTVTQANRYADSYEPNNILAQAHQLTATQNESVATVSISQATFHATNDVDYYIPKISYSTDNGPIWSDWDGGGVVVRWFSGEGSQPLSPKPVPDGALYLKIEANNWSTHTHTYGVNITITSACAYTFSSAGVSVIAEAGSGEVNV